MDSSSNLNKRHCIACAYILLLQSSQQGLDILGDKVMAMEACPLITHKVLRFKTYLPENGDDAAAGSGYKV
jgi:hypothetical protein